MVDFLLIEAFYKDEIKLSEKAINTLKPFKKVAVFAAVQFIKLDTVIEQLKKMNIEPITTHGKRTFGKFQLLGCDCFSESFAQQDIFEEADAILYVGDGLFHPKAMVLAQKGKKNPKDVILFDPIADTVKTIGQKDIETQLKRYKANLMKYMTAEKIGILVSTKTGQQYLQNAIKLKEQSSKNIYIFIDDTFNYANMENFPFIEVWVNTACPRIGYDDVTNMPKPLININDALQPEQALTKFT